MNLSVKLEKYEGPLDLLLALIEKNKIDIYDIPIVEITNQYLEYIKLMQEQDMNIMSEFLVMAATLLDIKCKMLLPKPVDKEGEEIDPREELVQKLLEYKMYKYMSYELKDRQIDAEKVFYRKQFIPDEVLKYREPVNYDTLVGDMDLDKLHALFDSIVKRQIDKIDPIRSQYGKIEKEEIDIDVKTGYVRTYILTNKRFSFRQLLEKSKSKQELVVTFLIILELMKMGEIMVSQEETFDDIIIESKVA